MDAYHVSDDFRRTLASTREHASRLGHDYIGAEHILLGVLDEPRGVAAQVLARIDPVRVRDDIEVRVPHGTPTGPNLPYTTRAKRVLELSRDEAVELGDDALHTEHLLLGLLREGHGIAVEVLLTAGLTLDDARRVVREDRIGRRPPPDAA